MVFRLFKQYPLLFRLVSTALLFGVLVTSLVAGIQVWLTYRSSLDEIVRELDRMQVSQTQTLANSLWNFNHQAVEIQLNSMLQHPDIVAITVQASDGTIFRVGEPNPEQDHLLTRSFPLQKEFRDQTMNMGRITLIASTARVRRQLWQRVSGYLILELGALVVTGGFILALFLLRFNRHINRIAEFTDSLEMDNLDRHLHLERKENPERDPDELDRIVAALNNMRSRLQDGFVARHRVEQQLQREIAFTEGIIDSLPGIFVVFNEQMQMVRCNGRYLEVLGITQTQALDFRLVDRVAPADREKFMRAVRKIFDQGEPAFVEVDMIALDNTTVPYLLTGSLLQTGTEKFLIGMGTDISERKRIEENLRQSQKMEVMGTLAGGIAHDFNNILTAIMGNLQLAQTVLGDRRRVGEYIQSGLDASLRAKDLVAQILFMSRRSQREKRPLNLGMLLREALKLLRASIPSTISIRQEIDSEGAILADAAQIHQVVMNLCTNAYQAMQDQGGELVISLRDEEIGTEDIAREGVAAAGDYVRLQVTDTGCGMDQDTLARIFEPYFTTKEAGAGTGLGLAVVQGIIQAHGGHINVDSEPGRGTTFTVLFPRLATGVDADKNQPGEPEETLNGRERILFVDDERHVLEVQAEILSMHGYTVTTFDDPEQALAAFRRNPSAWDLVVTDMTMPGMTGEELGQAMMEMRPDVPIILCTGFSRSLGREECLRAGFAAYLEKPLEARLFLRAVRRVLDLGPEQVFTLLLADDDPYNREVTARLLRRYGHLVDEVEDGVAVLERLARERFDGLVMDLQMPRMDGIRATALIRGCERGGPEQEEFRRRTGVAPDHLLGRHLPIIGLSGEVDETCRLACSQAGMDLVLGKPCTAEVIDAILDRIRADHEDRQCNSTANPLQGSLLEVDPDELEAYLRQLYPLGEEQVKDLLAEAVASLRSSLHEAARAMAVDDEDGVLVVLHRMKGTLLGLGLDAQAEWIRLAREQSQDGRVCPELMERLSRFLRPLLESGKENNA